MVKKDYYRKTIADKWKSSIAKAGLIWKQLGTSYISDSTKNGEHSKSALDYFYCSSDEVFSKYKKLNNSMSDHRPIVCSLLLKRPKKKVVARFTL